SSRRRHTRSYGDWSSDVCSSDLLERQGIEIHEDLSAANGARAATAVDASEADHKEEFAADSALDLSIGEDSKSQDAVRIYLREMGSVPLLTREGEVALAKRIECGQLVVMKAITRSPIVVKELISVAAALRQGDRSIRKWCNSLTRSEERRVGKE